MLMKHDGLMGCGMTGRRARRSGACAAFRLLTACLIRTLEVLGAR
jgi:hypothetical protein